MNNTPMTIEDSDEFPVMTFPSGDHPIVVRAEVARQLKRELREWEMLRSWGGTPAHVEAFIRGQQDRIHATQGVERELTAAHERIRRLEEALIYMLEHHANLVPSALTKASGALADASKEAKP